MSIDAGTRRTTLAGEQVHLTPTEFDLLLCLAREPGRVLTREQLLRDVWDWGDAWGSPSAARTVDSHVKALRAKLGAAAHPHGARRRLRAGGPAVSTPLDAVSSLKVRLGLLVVASVVVAVVLTMLGIAADVSPLLVLPVTVALALGVTQLLAAGMVAPLRQMTDVGRRDGTGRLLGPGAHHRDRRGRPPRCVRSTRWPRTSPRSTASGASSSRPSPTSCARPSPR